MGDIKLAQGHLPPTSHSDVPPGPSELETPFTIETGASQPVVYFSDTSVRKEGSCEPP